MNITKFAILGERCSGTNFLEESMTHNFNIQYTAEYGNKHFFCFNNYNSNKSYTDDTLFIGIIRNPIYWLNSFSKELYHVPEINRKNLASFLFNEFYSVEDEIPIEFDSTNCMINKFNSNKHKLNTQDLNYLTGKKYKNIFELRQLKNSFLMDVMPNKVNNYILINYEDLLYNFNETMTLIKDKFKLKQKLPTFYKVNKYKKSDTYNFVKQREILFSVNIISTIWKHLYVEQEEKLGYFLFDNNTVFKNKYKSLTV